MATKYWVGGTGTWDGFTATNWSDSDGGPGGAIAPCALDDVVFNSNSNVTSAYTVTINTGAVCRDLTISGPVSGNVTVAGSGALGIFGSLTLLTPPFTGITRTYTGAITFRATTTGKTITTNGITLASQIVFNGVGGYWTLQDALNIGSSEILVSNGTFDTNGKNLTCGIINSSGSLTDLGTLTLGTSTVSASNFTIRQNCTLNAGTSNITLSGASTSLNNTGFVGATFYNVTFSTAGSGNIFGANTFNNLTYTTPTNSALNTITIYGNQTITGTLTVTGSGAINRYMLLSDTIGTARTLTVGAVAALTDIDFRDITVAGASSPWSGTRLGNCGGNTNITFGAGVNKYWNQVAGGVWTDAAWATSSGGGVSATNFPLAQDTAIIENTGLNTSASITGFSGYNLKTLDCSTRSNAATLSGTNPRLNGNLTLSTSMTVAGLSVLFEGRTTQTITSAGRTLSAITVNNSGSTATLADAYNGSTITLTSGTFDTNNQNVTLSSSLSVTANALNKTWTFGSSTISCTAFSGSAGISNLTINAGTSSITLSSGLVLSGGTYTFYNVTSSNAASTNIGWDGIFIFNNLTFTAPTTVGSSTVTLGGNQTINGTLAFGGGTSVTQRRGFISSVAGTQRTITAATVSGLTDIDFRDIQGAGAGNWTVGTRLGDCGGNSGITFPAAKTVYWNLAGTQNWSATAWATSSGGPPAANNFPLAQDTAVFDDTGTVGTVTINAAWNIGTISSGGRTSAWTFTGGFSPSIYGDLTLSTAITINTFSGTFTFRKPGTQVFTTAGKTVGNIVIDNPSCVFRHGDAYNGNNITITRGTYETQNYTVTAGGLSSNNSNSRTITLGSSTVNLAGSTPITFTQSTGLTFNAGTSTLNCTTTGTITIAGGGQTFNVVAVTGSASQTATISGSNTFITLSNTGYSNLTLTSSTTQTFTNFNYTGASGSVVRISTTTPGLTATVQKPSTWYAGANSTDGGNNTGWTFTAGGSTDYVYLKDIIATISAGGGAGGKFFYLF